VHLLFRGASPAAACAQLEVTLDDFMHTWTHDDAFRERVSQTQTARSQNVAAALYRTAMEGSVTAQTFYLRRLPPPEWPQSSAAPSDLSPLNHLSDAELLERSRARRLDPTPESVDGDSPPSGTDESA
jgi:hypothetical protein